VTLRLGVALRFWAAVVAVTLARLSRGRALPRWTWRAIALPSFAIRGARFERTTLAGMDAVWITPRELPNGSETVVDLEQAAPQDFPEAARHRQWQRRGTAEPHAHAAHVGARERHRHGSRSLRLAEAEQAHGLR
jgi:hypothetical protein